MGLNASCQGGSGVPEDEFNYDFTSDDN